MKSLKNVKADEDFQTWELYPKYRNLFNKMDVALTQGFHAGPAGVAPKKEGVYISRPIYNLYGMGLGAKRFEYTKDMYDSFINNGVVPPGHFWCEWIDGDHLSVDYHRNPETQEFYIRSVWRGLHYSDDNLTRFESWERLDNNSPVGVGDSGPWADTEVTAINLEIRGGHIIEAHLRLGNDPWDDLPVGTVVTPVWHDMDVPEDAEFRGNLHEDMEAYSANGHLSDIRKGYIIDRPFAKKTGSSATR